MQRSTDVTKDAISTNPSSTGTSGPFGRHRARDGLRTESERAHQDHWCLQSLHTDPGQQNGEEMDPEALDSSRMEELSRTYFPVTLRRHSTASGSRLPPATTLVDPAVVRPEVVSAHGRRIGSANSGQSRSRHGHRSGRSGSAVSSSSSTSTNSFDPAQQPCDDQRIGVHNNALRLSSPFESTLTQLRLDKLRIEEERLLETKRQKELERIRGPLPKWYALKSSQFGRELRKHNELLTNRNVWQEHVDYRATLEQASQQYQLSFCSDGQ